MKQLILPFLILCQASLAADEINDLSDAALKNKFVSVIKDLEVQKMMEKTSEFNDCREKGKLSDLKLSDTAGRKARIAAAEACFKQKLTGQGTKKLMKLAEDLSLQEY